MRQVRLVARHLENVRHFRWIGNRPEGSNIFRALCPDRLPPSYMHNSGATSPQSRPVSAPNTEGNGLSLFASLRFSRTYSREALAANISHPASNSRRFPFPTYAGRRSLVPREAASQSQGPWISQAQRPAQTRELTPPCRPDRHRLAPT